MDPRLRERGTKYDQLNPNFVKARANKELAKMRKAGFLKPDGTFAQKNLSITQRAFLNQLREQGATGQLPDPGYFRRAKMAQDRADLFSGGSLAGPGDGEGDGDLYNSYTAGPGFFSAYYPKSDQTPSTSNSKPSQILSRFSNRRSGQMGLGRALGL